MKDSYYFLVLSAIFIAPHISYNIGLMLGVIAALIGFFLFINNE